LEAELAALITARVALPHVEMVAHAPQRIADIAAGTEVAPGHTKTEIEIAPAFAGHEVFTAEKTGTAHILKAQGDGGHVLSFLDQAQFEVDALVQIVAVADIKTPVVDRGIAKSELEPIQRL